MFTNGRTSASGFNKKYLLIAGILAGVFVLGIVYRGASAPAPEFQDKEIDKDIPYYDELARNPAEKGGNGGVLAVPTPRAPPEGDPPLVPHTDNSTVSRVPDAHKLIQPDHTCYFIYGFSQCGM
jgi:hypothetical protein